MKLACRFLCLVLLSGCCAFAGATPVDFNAHVLDPPAPGPFPTNPITTLSFSISFTSCSQGELPGGMTADGCFAGVNRTGLDWTNLQFVFPDIGPLTQQDAGCALAPSNNIFGSPNCPPRPTNGFFTLDFVGGTLANGALFFVTEDGVTPPESFPTGTATVLSTSTVTPEPTPLLLLGTGFAIAAVFGRKLQAN